nr:MAG TPA: hypothetical protein [Bacteriophage sp.]
MLFYETVFCINHHINTYINRRINTIISSN